MNDSANTIGKRQRSYIHTADDSAHRTTHATTEGMTGARCTQQLLMLHATLPHSSVGGRTDDRSWLYSLLLMLHRHATLTQNPLHAYFWIMGQAQHAVLNSTVRETVVPLYLNATPPTHFTVSTTHWHGTTLPPPLRHGHSRQLPQDVMLIPLARCWMTSSAL